MRAFQESRAATPRAPGEANSVDDLDAVRATCRRQAQEIHALLDTVAVLRAGANRLAANNAIMHAELAAINGPTIAG